MPTTKTVDLEHLVPDPHNKRSDTDQEAISRLAASIKQHGILQRLLVRPVNGRFMVVAGHRRLMAAQAAGLKRVPVEIRDIDEETARALQIIENLHREDVTPLDEAKAFDRLRGEDRNIEDIAALVGHSSRYVAQRLSLVNLTSQAKKALRDGSIRLGTAYALARITNAKVQKEALQYVDGDPDNATSVTRARQLIESRFEMCLASAPFDPEDESLVKGVGSCMACPKRAGNQPLLFEGPDLEARCTDPVCFSKKVKAAGRKQAKRLQDEDHTVHGIKASKEEFFQQGYRGWDLRDKWITPDQRASYDAKLTWGKVLKEELAQEEHQVYVVHPDSGVVLRIFPRSRAMKVAKEQGHEFAGARKKRKKTAAEKRQETEHKIQRLTEGHVTEALVARLDDVELDAHVDWLVDAILDAARSDSLKRTCQAFGLKREKELESRHGKEKESWRDRLCRAVREEEVTAKKVLMQVLMQEQGWRYRPEGTEQPSLRERLLVEFGIDEVAIGQKVWEDASA
jgi:ParB/RepB/Spo0J family partition protein